MIRVLVLVVAVAGGIPGCYSPTPEVQVDEWQKRSAAIGTQDGVAIVGTSDAVIEDIVPCVEAKLRDLSPDMQIIPAASFRDSLFPWLEPSVAPSGEEDWAKLKARPLTEDRIRELKARYIVAISGHSGKTSSTWGGTIGGPQGAIFVGGLDTREEASVGATVIDWASGRTVAEVRSSASGSSGAGIIILIPYLYFGPGAEKVACRTVARKVADFLRGEARPPDDDIEPSPSASNS